MFKTLLDQRVLFLMKSAISAGILGEGSPDTEMRGQSREISKDREGGVAVFVDGPQQQDNQIRAETQRTFVQHFVDRS